VASVVGDVVLVPLFALATERRRRVDTAASIATAAIITTAVAIAIKAATITAAAAASERGCAVSECKQLVWCELDAPLLRALVTTTWCL
jgi:hypothetical protein